MSGSVPLEAFRPAEVVATAAASEMFGTDGPCPILFEPGARTDVVVVSGENAGGKSLLCRAIQSHVAAGSKRAGTPVEVMRVGMDMRTASGMQRAFVYGGSEDDDSTGKLSVTSVLSGLETSRRRTNPHWLVFDEPDVGLGEGYRRAMGELFARFCGDLPKNALGFVVVTHSREIAGPMMEAGASSVRVGDDLRPVARWLAEGDLPKSVEDLEALHGKATERMRAVSAAMRARKEAGPSGPR